MLYYRLLIGVRVEGVNPTSYDDNSPRIEVGLISPQIFPLNIIKAMQQGFNEAELKTPLGAWAVIVDENEVVEVGQFYQSKRDQIFAHVAGLPADVATDLLERIKTEKPESWE